MYSFIIVDDEPLIRKGILKKVQAFGRALSFAGEADNGSDALKLIEETQPDILLTDMRMPEMDGKLLMRTVHGRYPRLKMIVISGHSDFEYMREAITAKAISYVLKPFSREELHEALQQAMDQLDEEKQAHLEADAHLAESEMLSHAADVQTLLQLLLGIQPSNHSPLLRSRHSNSLLNARLVLLTVASPPSLTLLPESAPFDALMIPHPQSEQLTFILLPLPAGEAESDTLDEGGRIAHHVAATAAAAGRLYCRVGVSLVRPDLTGLHHAYLEGIAALDRQLLGGGEPFAVFHQLLTADHGLQRELLSDWPRKHELFFRVEAGHAVRVQELVDDLVGFYSRQPHATLGQLKSQCRAILTEIKRLLAVHLKTDATPAPSRSLEVVLGVTFEPADILHYLQQVIGNITTLLGHHPVYDSGEVFDNIKSYLNQHYREELTLERVASLFYLNPSYLSHRFKEKTGRISPITLIGCVSSKRSNCSNRRMTKYIKSQKH